MNHRLMKTINVAAVLLAAASAMAAPLQVQFPGGADGNVGTPYAVSLTANGGTPPYTFSISSGTLPAGLTLNSSTGAISGIPTTQVSGPAAQLIVEVTDSTGATATANGNININPEQQLQVQFPGGANGNVGTPYSVSIAAKGGIAPYTFSISSGTLPPGLSLNASTGAITGQPTLAVNGPVAQLTVEATDSTNATATANANININPPQQLQIQFPGGTNGQVPTPFIATLTATGGIAPYTFSICSGTLPPGLVLNPSTGVISGTPITAVNGPATQLAAMVKDSTGATATANGNININPPQPLQVQFPGGANGQVGTPFGVTLTANGGIAPYTFSISAGTLPAGLSLNASTGVISGTPTAALNTQLTAEVTDTTHVVATANGNINIQPDPPPGNGSVDSCGYPYGAAPALTSVVFSESEDMYAFALDSVNNRIIAWYTDEHALTLGIRQVVVITPAGSTTTNFMLAPFTSTNSPAMTPQLGTTMLTGPSAGTDTATWSSSYGYLDDGRPIYPAIYATDLTINPNSTMGDWQQGGTVMFPPSEVYGTWKGAVRTYDETKTPAQITITPDSDPAQNNWTGIPDTPPSGYGNTQGYTAEIVWNLSGLTLNAGDLYRFQFMIHDGDQNKSGGDVGEACVVMQLPGQSVLQ